MKKQNPQKTSDKKNSEASSGKTLDAIALLKADHRQVKTLFQKFENASSDEQKKSIADQICKELIVHAKIEEELFYPTCRQNGVETEGLEEAQIEHDTAKILIQNLMDGEPDDPYFDATVKVLSEYIQHHVDEEEKPNSGIFAQAKKHGIDLGELGKKLKERKEQLQEQDVFLSPPLKTVAIKQHGKESDAMARRYNQDYEDDNNQNRYSRRSQQGENRDQYGRFTSDDNNRGRTGRGSYEQDDGSQRYSYRGSSGSRYQDDDENWGGSQGRNQSRGSQNYGGSSGRGQESQNRYSNRYEDDDDNRYGSSSSNRGGRGHQGQRGWFGDSEGHSEDAESGWENRNRYGQSNYEDNDEDDNRRYSSRSSYERSSQDRDERGRSRSSGSGSQGGWFGDSEGHSEAARRGWRNR